MDGLPVPRRYGAILAIALGITVAVLDGAIANVALPTIARDLHASPAQSIWIVNAYQLAIIISLLSLSFLGDILGYRRVYQCGLVIFTVTSLFCALSDSLEMLTFARVLQGFGGAAQGQRWEILLAEVAALVVIGYLFIRRQLAMTFPLLPVDLLRIPIFSLSICTSVCSFCAQMLAMVSLPFYLQSVLGRDEVATGLLLTPWPLATMVMAPIAGRMIERYHAGLLGGIGLAMFAAGLFALALLPSQPSDVDIIWRMMLCGAGFGLFQSPNNHTIISSAPRHRSGGASGMLGTARLLGQTSGAALVALMFNLFESHGTHAALILAGCFSSAAAIVSAMRMTQPGAGTGK